MKTTTITTSLKGFNRPCGYYAQYTISEATSSLLRDSIRKISNNLRRRGEKVLSIKN